MAAIFIAHDTNNLRNNASLCLFLLSKGWHRDMVRLIKTLCCNLIRLRRLVLPTQTGLFWNYTFYFHNTTTGTRLLDWLVGDLVIRWFTLSIWYQFRTSLSWRGWGSNPPTYDPHMHGRKRSWITALTLWQLQKFDNIRNTIT